MIVDVRIIAATNKNLVEEIAKGTFREDLYYRLNVIPFNIPPLRERKEDIPLLASHFNKEYSNANGKKERIFTEEALKILTDYAWPGNIRELRNVVEHVIIMSINEKIRKEDLPSHVSFADAKEEEVGAFKTLDLKTAKDLFEKEFIERKLKEFGGNVSKTAEEIGLERSHLHKKIKQYEIEN